MSESSQTINVLDCNVQGAFNFITGSFVTALSSQNTVVIQDGTYNKNYGFNGGVFYLSNLISLSVTDSIFTKNIAFRGGVFWIGLESLESQLKGGFDFSGQKDGTTAITLSGVTATGNSLAHATDTELLGGFMHIDTSKLIMTVEYYFNYKYDITVINGAYSSNSAVNGGIFFAPNCNLVIKAENDLVPSFTLNELTSNGYNLFQGGSIFAGNNMLSLTVNGASFSQQVGALFMASISYYEKDGEQPNYDTLVVDVQNSSITQNDSSFIYASFVQTNAALEQSFDQLNSNSKIQLNFLDNQIKDNVATSPIIAHLLNFLFVDFTIEDTEDRSTQNNIMTGNKNTNCQQTAGMIYISDSHTNLVEEKASSLGYYQKFNFKNLRISGTICEGGTAFMGSQFQNRDQDRNPGEYPASFAGRYLNRILFEGGEYKDFGTNKGFLTVQVQGKEFAVSPSLVEFQPGTITTNSVSSTSATLFSGNNFQDKFFELTQTDLKISLGSFLESELSNPYFTIKTVEATVQEGHFFTFKSSSVYIDYMDIVGFVNIKSNNDGDSGLLKSQKEDNMYLSNSLTNIKVSGTLTSTKTALFQFEGSDQYAFCQYSEPGGDTISTPEIELSNISLTGSMTAQTFLLKSLSDTGCSYKVENLSISGALTSADQDVLIPKTIFDIDSGKALTMSDVTLSNWGIDGTTIDTFLYSKGNTDIAVTATSFTVDCQETREKDLDTSLSTAFFFFANYASAALSSMKFTQCYVFNTGGLFMFTKGGTLTDSGSSYDQVSGKQGAIYNFQGSITDFAGTKKFHYVTISSNTYTNLRSVSGAVLHAVDQIYFSSTSCTYQDFLVEAPGAAFYMISSTTYSDTASLTSTSDRFENLVASQVIKTSGGGILFLSNSQVDAKFEKTESYNNFAQEAGFAFVLESNSFKVIDGIFKNNTSSQGTSTVFYKAEGDVTLTRNYFQGNDTFDKDDIQEALEVFEGHFDHGFHFANPSLTITLEDNYFKWFTFSKLGGVFFLNAATFIDKSSTYFENSSLRGGAVYCQFCKMNVRDSTFEENYALRGGAIIIQNDAQLTTRENVFEKNEAIDEGGAIFVGSESYVSLFKDRFEENMANEASALYFIDTSSQRDFLVKSCRFIENKAYSSTFLMIKSTGSIEHCTFKDNTATVYSQNLFMSMSTIEIDSCNFSEQRQSSANQIASTRQTKGNFMHIVLSVNLIVRDSTFQNGISSQGGAVYISGLSSVEFDGCRFINNYSTGLGGALFTSGYEALTFKNSVFTSNKSTLEGSDIYAQFSDYFMSFENTSIQGPSSKVSIYGDSVLFKSNRLKIDENDGYAPQGAGLTCINCEKVEIANSQFFGLKAENGGAIYLSQGDTAKNSDIADYSYKITDSLFQSNKGKQNGGSLYLGSPQNLLLAGNQFIENTVQESEDGESKQNSLGGAFYYTCEGENENCRVEMVSNTFRNNFSSRSGGAIKWVDKEPIGIIGNTNTYENNTAVIYGDDIASFPQKIIRVSEGRMLQETEQTLEEQKSGSELDEIRLALADKYGNIVSDDDASSLQISIVQDYDKTSPYPPFLGGQTLFQAEKGVFTVTGIEFTGAPTSEYSLTFTSDGIDESKPSNKEYLENIAESEQISFDLKIELRGCISGEAFTEAGKCRTCDSTFYSVEVFTEPGDCKECPSDKATCEVKDGFNLIGPKKGYWRSSAASDNFIDCLFSGACLGMKGTDPRGDCATGYQGIICADCEVGYSREGTYECGECPQPILNIFRLVFIFFVVVVFVIFLINSTLDGAKERKNVTSIYTKILMNHFQLLLLTANFEFDWPRFVESFFEIAEPVAQVSQQVISFDCFLDTRSGESEEPEEDSIFRIYYQKLIIFALMPLILSMVCYISWILVARKRKQKFEQVAGKAISSLVILLFLIHPNLVQYMFDTFNCKQIDNERRMINDLQIVCNEGYHEFWSLSLALPSIIVWGIGIPIFAFLLLQKDKNRLQSFDVKEKFGFLYNGYRKKYYYWEVIIMYRKIFIIFIAVFISNFGTITQALFVFILVISFLMINMKLQPFTQVALNDLENMSLIASMTTVYCGIFYMSDQPEVYQSSNSQVRQLDNGLRLSETVKIFMFLLIVLTNTVFFTFWIYKMMIEVRFVAIKKFKKIYTFVFLCGSDKKFTRIQQEVEEDELNEILREDYMQSLKNLEEIYYTGELQLNDANLEKLMNYLHPNRILTEAGISNESDLELKKQKERRKEREKASKNLISNIVMARTHINETDQINQDSNNMISQIDLLAEEKRKEEKQFSEFFQRQKLTNNKINYEVPTQDELLHQTKNERGISQEPLGQGFFHRVETQSDDGDQEANFEIVIQPAGVKNFGIEQQSDKNLIIEKVKVEASQRAKFKRQHEKQFEEMFQKKYKKMRDRKKNFREKECNSKMSIDLQEIAATSIVPLEENQEIQISQISSGKEESLKVVSLKEEQEAESQGEQVPQEEGLGFD